MYTSPHLRAMAFNGRCIRRTHREFPPSRVSGSVLLCYASDCTYQNELVTAAHIRIHAQTLKNCRKRNSSASPSTFNKTTSHNKPEFHQRYSQGSQAQAPQKVAAHITKTCVTHETTSPNLSRELLTFTNRTILLQFGFKPLPKKKAIIPNLCICHHDKKKANGFFFTTRNSFRIKIRLYTASQGENNRASHY
jgi:hypothetical protein